jgi:hypothetical protein
MAIVIGLPISFFVVSGSVRPQLHRLLLAMLVPAAAAMWQLKAGLESPNFTQAFVVYQQQPDFVSQPTTILLRESAWRVATIWRYIGMAVLAAVPLMLPLAAKFATDIIHSSGRFSGPFRLALVMVAMAAVSIFLAHYWRSHSLLSARSDSDGFLPLWWMLPNAFREHPKFMRWFDTSGLVGACLLGWIAIAHCATLTSARRIAFEALLLAAVSVSLLGLHLAFAQLNDTYLVGLLPFAVLVVAYGSRGAVISRLWVVGSIIACGIIVLAQSLWLRGDFNVQEAQWRAADELLAQGNAAYCIGASRHWNEYHGAFDEWLAETNPSFDIWRGAPTTPDSLHVPFYAWLGTRGFHATYQISPPWRPEPSQAWQIRRELPYRSALLQQRTIKVFQRIDDASLTIPCARNTALEYSK